MSQSIAYCHVSEVTSRCHLQGCVPTSRHSPFNLPKPLQIVQLQKLQQQAQKCLPASNALGRVTACTHKRWKPIAKWLLQSRLWLYQRSDLDFFSNCYQKQYISIQAFHHFAEFGKMDPMASKYCVIKRDKQLGCFAVAQQQQKLLRLISLAVGTKCRYSPECSKIFCYDQVVSRQLRVCWHKSRKLTVTPYRRVPVSKSVAIQNSVQIFIFSPSESNQLRILLLRRQSEHHHEAFLIKHNQKRSAPHTLESDFANTRQTTSLVYRIFSPEYSKPIMTNIRLTVD